MIPVAASVSTYATDAVLGLIQGAVYGLLAMGVVVIYRTTRTLNLAQGGMATLGAFTYIALRERGVPTPVAVVAVVAIGAAAGLGIGQLIGWPLRRANATVKLVSSLGVLLVVQSLVGIIFGNVPRSAPPLVSPDSITALGITVPVDGLVVLAVAAASAALLHRLLTSTRLGLHMRAVAADPEVAALQGVNVRLVTAGSWMLGVAIALGGGILLGPVLRTVAPFLLTLIALQALGATLLGRIDSLSGALAGGLILGELVTFAQELFPGTQGTGDIAVFLFILAVLLLQRRGGLVVERA
ncbi:MAG: branched-chain amino acid transporter permease [Chloroflexi bacterium]|nr:branched-chain amino acid transporter permease [Chloroflexota bacterium]MEA2616075.1 branched-chain amino acid transport system permease protein [Chloroflexota bacterium]